jgi:hypothetical protein
MLAHHPFASASTNHDLPPNLPCFFVFNVYRGTAFLSVFHWAGQKVPAFAKKSETVAI